MQVWQKGCLEVYAAGPGISLTYCELCGAEKNGEELARMAREGDEAALRVWELEGMYLGRAVAFAANVLNPRRVILGRRPVARFSALRGRALDGCEKEPVYAAKRRAGDYAHAAWL